MSRRPALVTQADVARAIRAAKQAGAADVEIKPSGAIIIHLQPKAPVDGEAATVDPAREIIL